VTTLFANEPMMAELFAYWDAKRGDRVMPDRRDIDPVEINPAILPHLLLCEFHDEGQRVRFRLIGTKVVERTGTDYTGKFLEEMMSGGHLAYVSSIYRDVWLHKAPVYSESTGIVGVGNHVITRRIFLPIAKGPIAPAMSLAVQTFSMPEGADTFSRTKVVLNDGAIEELRRARLVAGEVQTYSTGRDWK